MKQFFKNVFSSMVGFLLGSILLLMLVIGIVASAVSSLTEDKEVTVKSNSVLHVKLGPEVNERGSDNPFENFDFNNMETKRNVGLNDILASIKAAKNDSAIRGIYLDLGPELMTGYATLQEIRDALIEFRTGGKFVYAYAEIYTKGSYFLASAADKVYLNPAGDILFNGLYADVWFFKNALDKLGVEVQVFKVGKFKSAVEPFLLDKMSEDNRRQVTRYVTSLFDTYLANVSATRKVSVADLRSIADELKVQNPTDAVTYGLVDTLYFEDQVYDKIRQQLEMKEDEKINFITLGDYAGKVTGKYKKAEDRIAIIYATGTISSGKSSNSETMGSDNIVEALRAARKNDKVKAVVLRINSPGGSALASDVILREVELTRKKMPVIVSMGDVAASGGYFIACTADTIVAQRNTITGSIGVFGMIPQMQKLLNDKLGITVDGVKTGQFSDLGRVDRPMTPAEKDIIQKMVNTIYDDFTGKVAAGRHMHQDSVKAIAEGRVWTGEDALAIGLVDVLGGIDVAIRIAAEKAKITDYKLLELPKLEQPFAKIFGNATQDAKESVLREELGFQYDVYQQMKAATRHQGIQMRMPFEIKVN